MCLPGPASYGQTLAAYPSSFQLPEDGRRVRRPGDVQGHGAARGLHIQAHRGVGGVPGAVAALGQLPVFGCRPSAQANRWAFLESYKPLALAGGPSGQRRIAHALKPNPHFPKYTQRARHCPTSEASTAHCDQRAGADWRGCPHQRTSACGHGGNATRAHTTQHSLRRRTCGRASPRRTPQLMPPMRSSSTR